MTRLTFTCAVALATSVAWPAYGQDGRIVAQQPFTLDESLRKEIVAKAEFTSAYTTPRDIFAAIERVDMREITYLSDRLRVKGFVLAPKKAGRRFRDRRGAAAGTRSAGARPRRLLPAPGAP